MLWMFFFWGGIFSPTGKDPQLFTRSEAIEHIRKHQENGEDVPNYVIEALESENKENR